MGLQRRRFPAPLPVRFAGGGMLVAGLLTMLGGMRRLLHAYDPAPLFPGLLFACFLSVVGARLMVAGVVCDHGGVTVRPLLRRRHVPAAHIEDVGIAQVMGAWGPRRVAVLHTTEGSVRLNVLGAYTTGRGHLWLERQVADLKAGLGQR